VSYLYRLDGLTFVNALTEAGAHPRKAAAAAQRLRELGREPHETMRYARRARIALLPYVQSILDAADVNP
jgi:hypothetical protein